MIEKLDAFPDNFLGYDVFATKIECDFYAYSAFPFAQFFKATQNGMVTAVISFIDGFMCISENNTDTEQLKQFIGFLRPNTVSCDSTLAKKIGVTGKEAYVLERYNFGTLYDEFKEVTLAEDVYNELVLFAKDELNLPERNAFVSDFSFKQRRSLNLAVSNGKAVAVAFAVGKDSAYIGAVATDKKYRKNGFGAKAVETILFKLKSKKAYLFCEENNLPFYEKLNFKIKAKAIIGE